MSNHDKELMTLAADLLAKRSLVSFSAVALKGLQGSTGKVAFHSASFVSIPQCNACGTQATSLWEDLWVCPKCGQKTGHTGVFALKETNEE